LQLPIGEWISDLQAGIGLVPPALIAMVLLSGPTVAWLLYRFVVQPRSIRSRAYVGARFWVCPNCRSVNDIQLIRCYRCDSRPAAADIEVIDATPSAPRRLVPVGPGLDLGGPRPVTRPRPVADLEYQTAGWETDTSTWRSDAEEEWEDLEEDRAVLPDVAAMTELIEAPGGRRTARPPTQIPVVPSRPAVARPRIVAVVGPARDPDDSPAA
jgi:hypothetical protein